jgi:hypothetical protein
VVFFETQHEAAVALHPGSCLISTLIMGIQYFGSLSQEKLSDYFWYGQPDGKKNHFIKRP